MTSIYNSSGSGEVSVPPSTNPPRSSQRRPLKSFLEKNTISLSGEAHASQPVRRSDLEDLRAEVKELRLQLQEISEVRNTNTSYSAETMLTG